MRRFVYQDDLPRLIFTLSPGRCGTKYLAALLETVPGVHSAHEGTPDFVDWARAARRNESEAGVFWTRDKLPHIASLECDVYSETSHLFGKGFVKPLLDLGITPDVIVLDRDNREVALSYWRRGSIPARTMRGQRYLLHPEVAQYCKLPQWWRMSDYQLCYWYTLEMAERTEVNVARLKNAGAKLTFINFDWLTSEAANVYLWMQYALGLPEPDKALFDQVAGQRYNSTPPSHAEIMPPGDIGEQEQEVIDAIQAAGETPRDERTKIDIIVLTMETVRKELLTVLSGVVNDRRYSTTIGNNAANPTANNRCQICKEFVDNERRPEWLGMIDEDTVPNGDFLRWVESGADVISFATPCWKPATNPHSPIVWNVQLDKEVEKFAPTIHDPDVEMFTNLLPNAPYTDAASAGTGAILIRRRVLEHPQMRAPFVDEFNEFGIRKEGHDLAFCRKARELGFKVISVLQNPCSHYKEIDLLDVFYMLKGLQKTNG